MNSTKLNQNETMMHETSSSSYSMRKVSLWCHNCQIQNNIFTSVVGDDFYCGRCQNACEIITRDNDPRRFEVYQSTNLRRNLNQRPPQHPNLNGSQNQRSMNEFPNNIIMFNLFHPMFVPNFSFFDIFTFVTEKNQETNHLTSEQIKRLPTKIFKSPSEHGNECSICQDNYNDGEEVTELPCKHNYHGACISKWLTQKNSCPVCRAEVEIRQN